MSPGEVTRNFYRKQGADAERERIIKLIELIQSTAMEEAGILEAVISAVKGERVTTYGYEWINDRIKGENK